ncbi:MAG: hypothetical protein JWO37_2341 [Acidimicrobiales bacterium]|nr:hypothetical protein [Acidimicrobiales bacterium]
MQPVAAVWIAARAQLRRRWGATVALVLLVGLAGGAVIAAVAGASRTDSSMKRFVAYSRPEDAFVIVDGGGGIGGPPVGVTDAQIQAFEAQTRADRARLVHLPEVEEAGRSPYMFLSPDQAGKELGGINPFAAADAHAFRTMDRPRVLRGRFARLDRPDEAIVDDTTARLRHLHVGSRVTMWSFSAEQNNDVAAAGFGKIPRPEGPAYTFRIVGIVRSPADVDVPPATVVGDALFQGAGGMVLTPAFLRRFAQDQRVSEEALPGMEGFRIRLRHGTADVAAFRQSLQPLQLAPEDVHIGGSEIQNAGDKAQPAIHLEAIALLLFAGLAAVAALLLVGQALARQVTADAEDNRTLAALGLGRGKLVLIPLARAAVVALAGGVVADAVALGLSPLTPIGLARRAEIHPGVSLNIGVLTLGFVGVAGLALLRALLPAWRAAGALPDAAVEQAPARPGPLGRAVAGAGLGPTAMAGIGMSFERGRGMAFRAALLGAFVAVAATVAAVTFGDSLRHLVDTPRQQGWNWDVVVGNPNTQPYAGDPAGQALYGQMRGQLANNRYVGSFSALGFSDATSINGRPVELAGIETTRGSVWQPIIEGRAPVSADELVLGRDPLRNLHKRVGQTVVVRAADQSVAMRIVGVSLQPTAGDMAPRLSGSGATTLAGLRHLVPNTPALQFAVRFRPGVNRTAAIRSLLDDFGRQVLTPYPGGEVGNLARVDFLPYVLAGLLVILAVGALGLTLLNSVRRHRRDLAVLKTIGFARGQVSATVAWQATALAVPALVLGIPAGIALGRWTWRLVAEGAGSVSPPIIPLLTVAAVVPLTVLVANFLAAAPAWSAGRVQPARVLRSE